MLAQSLSPAAFVQALAVPLGFGAVLVLLVGRKTNPWFLLAAAVPASLASF